MRSDFLLPRQFASAVFRDRGRGIILSGWFLGRGGSRCGQTGDMDEAADRSAGTINGLNYIASTLLIDLVELRSRLCLNATGTVDHVRDTLQRLLEAGGICYRSIPNLYTWQASGNKSRIAIAPKENDR